MASFCGCEFNFRIFDINRNRKILRKYVFSKQFLILALNQSEMSISMYKGCFSNHGETEVEIGFLSNELCVQYCHSNSYMYSLTLQGYANKQSTI